MVLRDLVAKLRQSQLEAFSTTEFRKLMQLEPASANSLLHRLVRQGWLERPRRGQYVLGPLLAGPEGLEGLSIATRLFEPCYVSFWSGLHQLGWTEQVPKVIQVATTLRTASHTYQALRVVAIHLDSRRFFGYQRQGQGQRSFLVAQPEKLLLDCLYLPRRSGGLDLLNEAVRIAAGRVNTTVLAEYACRFDRQSVTARLGFLLEEADVDATVLLPLIGKTYQRLDPTRSRKGRYHRRWMVVDNRPEGT